MPTRLLIVALFGLTSCSLLERDEPTWDSRVPEADFSVLGEQQPSARTLYTMARLCASQGRDAQCELVLNELVDSHPGFAPGWVDLSELYVREDRIDDAVHVLTAGLRHHPEDVVLLNDLGVCQLMRGRAGEALELFTDATAQSPDDARTRANMALALGMLGRHDEAASLYGQFLTPADAHHNLGVAAAAIGDTTRAEQEFALARQLGARDA